MEEKKLVPKLRFPGFTEPWEQRKLGEMASFSKGNGYFKSDLKSTGIPIILYGRLYTKYETVIEDIDTFADAKEGAVYSLGGEVIVPASGETAEEISIASVVQNPGVLLGGDLNIIRPTENLLPSFLALSISNGSAHREMSKRAQGKSVVHLHNEDLAQIDLKYPSVEEQSKITACINWVDNLITLHQRKLEHLKLKKKSLLQKLFPKEGEVYPELRFPGFTDPWEQRKFKYLFQKNLERNDGQFPFNKTISISRMIYSESGNGASTESLDNYKVLRVGDIAFEGHENKDFKFGRFVMNDVGNGIMSPRFTVLRPLIDMELNFWKEYINYEPIMQKKLVYSTKKGTMMNELVIEDFLNQYVAVPSAQEQQKIGYLLKCMTDDITLHQRKLEHLQLLKKALLQQLFV